MRWGDPRRFWSMISCDLTITGRSPLTVLTAAVPLKCRHSSSGGDSGGNATAAMPCSSSGEREDALQHFSCWRTNPSTGLAFPDSS